MVTVLTHFKKSFNCLLQLLSSVGSPSPPVAEPAPPLVESLRHACSFLCDDAHRSMISIRTSSLSLIHTLSSIMLSRQCPLPCLPTSTLHTCNASRIAEHEGRSSAKASAARAWTLFLRFRSEEWNPAGQPPPSPECLDIVSCIQGNYLSPVNFFSPTNYHRPASRNP